MKHRSPAQEQPQPFINIIIFYSIVVLQRFSFTVLEREGWKGESPRESPTTASTREGTHATHICLTYTAPRVLTTLTPLLDSTDVDVRPQTSDLGEGVHLHVGEVAPRP